MSEEQQQPKQKRDYDKDAPPHYTDGRVGEWTKLDLLQMDTAFCRWIRLSAQR